jgi:uncharacterized protein (DUF2147 family)
MKQILLIFTLLITFATSAQYTIISAVALNEGAEDQYLKLEEFYGPAHDLAVEKGLQTLQAVFKVTSETDVENGPHFVIVTGFNSKEQLDNYQSGGVNYGELLQEAYKGKMSSRRITRMASSAGSESKERRNYVLQGVDQTIWAGGNLEPGDTMGLTPTEALNDDFESYETEFWKPYIEKAIMNGQHRYWALSKVIDLNDNAYDGITHFFWNISIEGSNWWDGLDQDDFKFQKLQEGLNAASNHADPITLELVSIHN